MTLRDTKKIGSKWTKRHLVAAMKWFLRLATKFIAIQVDKFQFFQNVDFDNFYENSMNSYLTWTWIYPPDQLF